MRLVACSLVLLWATVAHGARYTLCTALGSNAANGKILQCDAANQGSWIATTTTTTVTTTTTTTTSTTTTSTTTTTTSTTTTTTVYPGPTVNDFRFYAFTQYEGNGTATAATGILDVGQLASGVVGTSTAFQDSTGAYVNIASAASTNSNGVITGPTNLTSRILLPNAEWVIKTGTVISVVRTWVVFNDTAPPAPFNADDPAGANLMGFRYSTSAGDTVWQCASKDGTTLQTTSSGVTVVADTRYEMRVDATSGTDVKYYINGSLVCTNSTHIPTNTASLEMFAGVRTLENVAKSFRFRVYVIRSL